MDYRTIAVLGPFLIPLGAFAVAIVAILSGAWRNVQARRVRAEQRLAMLSRGMSIAEIEQLLNSTEAQERRSTNDPLRSLRIARRTGTILISTGLGVIAFGIVLTAIVRQREVLAVAATGIIPLAIGIGFWFDYRTQSREITRLGLGSPEAMVPVDRPA